MNSPLKIKPSKEIGRRSNSPVKVIDGNGKGKGRISEGGTPRKPGSQLKSGWKLQPIEIDVDLGLTASSSVKRKAKASALASRSKRAASERRVQRSDPRRADSDAQARPASQVRQNGVKQASAFVNATVAIEIPSDSDDEDDIVELDGAAPFASTSAVKIEEMQYRRGSPSERLGETSPGPFTSAKQAPSRGTSGSTLAGRGVPSPPPNELDLDDVGDLLEDDTFYNGAREDGLAAEPMELVNDDDILVAEDDDQWGDAESLAMRRRNSMDAEGDFGGSVYGEEEDSLREIERDEAQSDEDILELMERRDSMDAEFQELKAPGSGLLKPLTSLARCISPSAATHKVTLDTRPNAFTALMQGNNLDKKWAEAEESEKAASKRGFLRPAPFYKILEGMTIAVDAFKYGKIPGVQAYFLSHAHSDHYTNLSSSWANGPIYCSVGTANLIRYKLGVKDEWLHPLPFDETIEIAGVRVTVIDANHCPGSSIFVFEGPHTSPSGAFHRKPTKIFRYLHCGDFRASPAHLLHPAIKGKKFDICYLDTTYLNPKYCFPAQEQVVDACAELIKARVEGDRDALKKGSGGGAQLVRQGEMMKGWLSKAKKEELEDEALNGSLFDDNDKHDGPGPPGAQADKKIVVKDEKPIVRERLLVMVGTYSIGKERIVKGIARAINAKVYADKRKTDIFACQDDPELMSMLTDDPLEGQIHVTWLGQIKVDELSDYLDKFRPHFTHIVGLRPTGWTFKPEGNMALTLKNPSVIQMISRELQRSYNPSWMTPTKDSTRLVEAYGVPYSEHSSFAELTCFAVSFDCVRFIPTVNVGSKQSRAKMAVWIDKWAAERKRRKAAGEPLMVPHRTMSYW